jgi:VIT1/CCC1 family predicted Fe2+/Mn2+ transporter
MTSARKPLEHQHTPEAVQARLAQARSHSYLGDFVFGAIDGTVTTFAVVSGSAGAGLDPGIAIVLGFANLLADGFSMAAGNYLSTSSEAQLVERVRRMEERHIEQIPEGEKEEIRQIFAAKGLEGDALDEVVRVITRDRRRWVDTMVTEEFGLQLHPPSAWRAAAATFVAFCIAGFVPLSPLLLPLAWVGPNPFAISAIATGLTFFLIGMIKGRMVERSAWRSGLETLLVGGSAAFLAYLVGLWLQGFAAPG